jgi:flagellum-specific peptidoglycan hydrolase FlgJ
MSQLSSTDSKANIKLLKDLANKAYPDQPILADMTIVQGILEGGLQKAPPSLLAIKYNNLFGIKGQGTKGSVTLMTYEDTPDKGRVQIPQQFAYNASVEDSVLQHKILLSKDRYVKVGLSKTFPEAAQAIKDAGYATDIHYPQLLIDTYNQYVK